MKQLLLDIVNSIVDHPDKVKLSEDTDSEGNLNFTLTVDPEDMGKIIGKEGKVIKSIRTIIRIPAIKQNKKVNLELTEQERVVKEGESEEPKGDLDEEPKAPKSKDSESEEGGNETKSNESSEEQSPDNPDTNESKGNEPDSAEEPEEKE